MVGKAMKGLVKMTILSTKTAFLTIWERLNIGVVGLFNGCDTGSCPGLKTQFIGPPGQICTKLRHLHRKRDDLHAIVRNTEFLGDSLGQSHTEIDVKGP
jgi:hypothetical protein